MHAKAVARLGLQSEVRHTMERHELEMYYQPIVRLDEGGTDYFEALVRWHHPTHGVVQPIDFLPDLEEAGLAVALGRWIVDEVCRQIAQWQRSFGGTVTVSVNLSHGEFADIGLLPHILACLKRYELVPANLTLEIPEDLIMRRPDLARAIIEQLHSAGIGVQIDDFGTGTSPLHALHRFPVRALKIDSSLIHDVGIDSRTTKLVQIIIAMGQALGIDVVAEGVETAAQYELLRQMGCRNAQGFWFAEAVNAEAAAAFLGRSIDGSRPRGDRLVTRSRLRGANLVEDHHRLGRAHTVDVLDSFQQHVAQSRDALRAGDQHQVEATGAHRQVLHPRNRRQFGA